ncbi:copper fist DNA binding domain-containing protein [Gamsiella multidivaricata]|uniref:copper fist DNA binding domain-containing protein n=1 Tax=Gamsiella multidivaricata TaxID=101098 RepID=UPI0022204AF5|nr:copper fist DNA binding domain-containing protein [Gamsiella multidivaricata]KAI7822577.1 copper fist DNA binding domain-containing protein [Gamsiella multidivaricata]
MVFVNGQKFACATCIKGHRSTTCNHGERPLHEIKKKGRPSTQCAHCKELRKAKHVNARCICGREEGSAAVANGLKRAKSLSHDGRLSVPAAISGEDLLRSVSTQCNSPQNCSDALSSNGGRLSTMHSPTLARVPYAALLFWRTACDGREARVG